MKMTRPTPSQGRVQAGSGQREKQEREEDKHNYVMLDEE
jgi:hypothetical protein